MSAADPSMTLRRGSRLGTALLRFHFDGRTYSAQEGDTVASALLANGVCAMGRSMKSRRLRGPLSAGLEEPGALLTVGDAPALVPNIPATQLRVREGLVLRSQNRWPSLHWDLASVLQLGGGLFSAGFYYKTFLWPSWRTYEPLIRRLAGLGAAPGRSDLPRVGAEHLACDVLVAGAGAAGLAAALAAARGGARVVLCERDPACGGELDFEGGQIDGLDPRAWLQRCLTELAERGVRVLPDTTLMGGSGGRLVAMAAPDGMPGPGAVYHIRPRAFVVATGSVERPIAFVNNDLPGVMLMGAAERYLARYGAAAGRELVLFANHDRQYATALRLQAAGLRVRALVDPRPLDHLEADPAVRAQRAQLQQGGTECLVAHALVEARGGRRVHAACVQPLSGGAADSGRSRSIPCDAILVSGGWSPEVHAGLHEGGVHSFTEPMKAFGAAAQPAWRQLAGACNGQLELAAVLADGHKAGEQAARAVGAMAPCGAAPLAAGDAPPRLVPYWRSPAPQSREKHQYVDLQNDVTVADLRQALAEGLYDIEHVKRYTTLGMGTDQGRTSAVLGAAIFAELKGETLPAVGISRTRPPYHPMPMAAIAGLRTGVAFRVARRTPLHAWHAAHGGVLDPMGLWMRPRYYRANGPDAFVAAVAEARCVRATGGIVDASTLGKIEVAGPAAAAFLDALYLSKASTLRVGRGKYMLNLREDGMALDDGLVLRLADDRFLATTSSGHGEHMLSHFEHYRDTEFAGAALSLTDVTDAWAVIGVAGPRSRAALQAVLETPARETLATLGHMGFLTTDYQGRDLRVLRAGFSGELAYELHCRPDAAAALWAALHAQGLEPYGIDALDILRVEKGYLTSSEITGQTTPLDLGLEAMVALGNPCVGRALLERPAFHEATRPRLVGLRAADGQARFLAGAQLASADSPNRPCGYVTSAVYSPTLEQWVGLALVARSLATLGTLLTARDPLRHGDTRVQVCSPVHVDPAGERIRS